MDKVLSLAIIPIILSCLPPSAYSMQCYQCNGLLCTSVDSFIKVNCPAMCFVVSLAGTEVFRGCYAEGQYMVDVCNQYRTSRCYVCEGDLCNKQVYTRGIITCRVCDRGVCSEKTAGLGFYQACPQFRFPELPRCFTIVDPWTMEYTFGCSNQLTLEQNALCEKDYTGSVCRICDTPNCNNKFFYPQNKKLTCYKQADKSPVTCENTGNTFGYYGCYRNITKPVHSFGCFNTLFPTNWDPRYERLWTGSPDNSLEVCTENNCNNSTVNPKKTYCGQDDKITVCPGIGDDVGSCALYKFKLEYNEWITVSQCLGRFPCWRSTECRMVCRGGTPEDSCTVVRNLECFTCTDCTQVNYYSPLNVRMCQSAQKCAMIVTAGNVVVRGCLESTVAALCTKYKEKCVQCDYDGCNHTPAIIYCHQCSPYNPMCPYTQIDTLSYECEGVREGTMNYSFSAKTMCFSGVDSIGRVTRGCTVEGKQCPYGLVNCTKCEGNYCNQESYVFSHCIVCQGGFNSSCANNMTYLSSPKVLKLCPVPYDTPNCYVSIRNGQIWRGCVADYYYKEVFLLTCSYLLDCFFCEGESCNYWSITIAEIKSKAWEEPKYRIMRGRLRLSNGGNGLNFELLCSLIWVTQHVLKYLINF